MELLNTLVAIASFGFAVISWWMAKVARSARDAARAERDRAERQANAVESIAKSLVGPLLTGRHVGDRDGTIVVSNASSETVVIEDLVNAGDFHMWGSLTRDSVDVWPVTIPPHALHRFYALMDVEHAMPDYFSFRVAGHEELVHVGLQPAAVSRERR